MARNEQEVVAVQTERAMIPVSMDTQRRIMELVGKVTAKRGKRTSQEFVINLALDAVDADAIALESES